jgi:hypothetical protein
MGMELLEMVMEVEEIFGIEIAHEDFGRIRTVGDFHALIMQRLAGTLDALSMPDPEYVMCKLVKIIS